jgi:hypothetical protein
MIDFEIGTLFRGNRISVDMNVWMENVLLYRSLATKVSQLKICDFSGDT